MLAQEIIRRKRDGHCLQRQEIEAFVRGLVDGTWSEGQAAAMAMAMVLRGMSSGETVDLTHAMTRSGLVLDWTSANLNGPILDKHSTGGVGDKVSLMLAPIVAACGGFVPMISGRGLGHTGGTLDKLDSIPGYQSAPDASLLRQALRTSGCAIIGQTAELAPADRRLYAIRDVTATVESVALITASILSKKLAAGLQGLVMDVKLGNGAFAASNAMATELAESLVTVANAAGLPTRACITDMNQVLGDSCGNAVEVREGIIMEFRLFGAAYGYRINVGTRNAAIQKMGEEFLNRYRQEITDVVEQFGAYQTSDLELLSTVAFVAHDLTLAPSPQDWDEIANVTSSIIPNVRREYIVEKIRELAARNVLSGVGSATGVVSASL